MGKMQLINVLLVWLFFGLLTSYFARKRGRCSTKWFFVGLFMGIFSLPMLFLIPPIKKKATQSIEKKGALPMKRSDAWLRMWYYLDPTHAQQGPLEFPDLIKIWKSQQIGESTYIWGEGMKEWKRLSEQPELLQEIEQF